MSPSTNFPPLRSVLLSTGADEAVLARNMRCGADALCVDLEDTVTDKVAARSLASSFFRGSYAGLRGLRLNPLTDEDGLRDILMLREAGWTPDVVILTMIVDPFEIRLAHDLLPANCQIIALIETARGLERLNDIAAASNRLRALMFGGKDLAYSLGSGRNDAALDYGRNRMKVAASAAGVLALDENYRPLDDLEGLALACRRVRNLGYQGRLTIDDRHVPVINEIFGAP